MKKYVEDRIESWNIPSDVDAFFAKIEARIAASGVPRDEIAIEVSYEHSYGDSVDVYISLSYQRDETEQERLQREEKARRLEERERNNYERLKAKFEGKEYLATIKL